MSIAAEMPRSMDVEIDCGAPGCEAGQISHQHERIDPEYIKHHLEHHAYSTVFDSAPKVNIGADCDCPRILDPLVKRPCQACRGTGKKHVILTIPRPGSKVKVKDADLMNEIFGCDQPESPGVVFDIQTPEQHNLELRSGIGVRVTWDPLTTQFRIRKGTQAELWTFDLLELEIVR